jgi:flagellar hook-associated protein 3 FlgL
MTMRVTQGMTNRSYLYNLNTAQYNMNKSSEKLQTGRKYSRVSEDVHGATKCLTLRAKLYRNDRVQQGVAEAINEMDMAESTLTSIKDIASNVQEEMIKAMDEPKLTASKSTFLAFLQQSKENILGLANKQYNDKYLLGDLKAGETPYT